ncbi:hypothetical protein Tco_1029609 [Tanacetum coccineum]|uniref:Uncharacterized protein n=1 Tax=Tanacetum coccineum TaxID=301880 RepID=A0ABQ5G560_9ASTR
MVLEFVDGFLEIFYIRLVTNLHVVDNVSLVQVVHQPKVVHPLFLCSSSRAKEKRPRVVAMVLDEGDGVALPVVSNSETRGKESMIEFCLGMMCAFPSMLCDLDFEPLSLSLSSLPSCDLLFLTNMLILLHYLESFKSEFAEVFVFKS